MSISFYKKAANCSKTISWFSEFLNNLHIATIQDEIDPISGYAVEKIQNNLCDFGGNGTSFENDIEEKKKNIMSNDSKLFEIGLTELGNMLGFETYRPITTAAPDSIWRIGDYISIIFEAKSDESSDGDVSSKTCTQSIGHYKWVKDDDFCKGIEKRLVVVTTSRKTLDNNAKRQAENLYYINIERIREIYTIIEGIYRRIRSQSIKYDEETVRQSIISELKTYGLDPQSIISEVENKPLKNLPIHSGK